MSAKTVTTSLPTIPVEEPQPADPAGSRSHGES